MKTPSLRFVVTGILAVAAIGLVAWQQWRLAQSHAELGRLRSEVAVLSAMRGELARLRGLDVDQAELAHLRERQAAAQRELPGLRAKAAGARRAEADAARLQAELERQVAGGSEGTNGMAVPMADLMRGGMEQMTRRRLARMGERLNLSPAQAQAIDDILMRRARGIAEATKGVITGKMDHAKLAALRSSSGDPESQIRALLTTEQQSAYEAFQEEERLNSARLAASGELLQMQHTLALTDEQQDQVFTALYDEALRQLRTETAGPEPANPAEAMQAMMNRKLQALEGVLTPAQLANYRQDQELQLGFLRGIASQMQPPSPQP